MGGVDPASVMAALAVARIVVDIYNGKGEGQASAIDGLKAVFEGASYAEVKGLYDGNPKL